MPTRQDNLQQFVDSLEASVWEGIADAPQSTDMSLCLFDALKTPARLTPQKCPSRLPACRHFDPACAEAQQGPKPIAELSRSLAAIEPDLHWTRRQGITDRGDGFYDGHANAIVVGKGGLEERDDLMIGVSLVAPNIHYPKHRHPPEEFYVVLSPGKWMQQDQPFKTKLSGEMVHHDPNVWHAMQGTEVPLLAIWCLWL